MQREALCCSSTEALQRPPTWCCAGVVATTDVEEATKDVDYAIMVGGFPRKAGTCTRPAWSSGACCFGISAKPCCCWTRLLRLRTSGYAGMERKDVMAKNVSIYKSQASALEKNASKGVKVCSGLLHCCAALFK